MESYNVHIKRSLDNSYGEMINKKSIFQAIVVFAATIGILGCELLFFGAYKSPVIGNSTVIWLFLQGAGSVSMLCSLKIFVRAKEGVIDKVLLSVCSIAYPLCSYSILQTGDVAVHIVIVLFPLVIAFYDMMFVGIHHSYFLVVASVSVAVNPVIGGSGVLWCIICSVGRKMWNLIFPEQKPAKCFENRKIITGMISLSLAAPFWLPGIYRALYRGSIVWDNPRIYVDWLTHISRLFFLTDESVYISMDHGSNPYCGVIPVFMALICFISELYSYKIER